MFQTNKPYAKVIDSRLILSLPNAVTPVVWIMDLADEGTFILRIHQNENGFFIVQKVSRDGKKTEDIAFYSKKNDAQKAMALITNATGNDKGNDTLFGILKKIVVRIIFIIALVFVCMVTYVNRDIIFGINIASQAVAPTAQQTPDVPITDNPEAVGVPMNADDFFNRPEARLPF
jgi:hypothetical protein